MELRSQLGNMNKIIAYGLLTVIASIYIYFILKNANWTWGDDYEFLISTAVGKIEWSLHIANRGRFYPFGHFDFNILTLIPGGASPLAHYILVAVSFLFFVFFSYKLYAIVLKEARCNTNFNPWLIIITITFLLYYFFRVFFFLVYPERMIIVLLTLFFVAYYKFIKQNSTAYAIIAILVAIYLSYCKETIFLVFSMIVGLNLMFNFKNIILKQKLFYYALGINVIVFLLLYYFIAYKNADTIYSRNSNLKEVLIFSVGNLKLLYISLFFAFWRVYRLLVKKDRQNLFFDSMLFSGVIYALANVILKLPMEYYYFPAVMLTMPALLYWAAKLVHPKWILIVLVIITVYYGRKFPRVIDSVQGQRTETSKHVMELIRYMKASDYVLWYENPRNGDVEKGLIGYQKEILDVYVNFYDNSINNTDLQIINWMPDSVANNTLIFYSGMNTIDFDDNNEWDKKMESMDFEKLDLPNIYQISIYNKQ